MRRRTLLLGVLAGSGSMAGQTGGRKRPMVELTMQRGPLELVKLDVKTTPISDGAPSHPLAAKFQPSDRYTRRMANLQSNGRLGGSVGTSAPRLRWKEALDAGRAPRHVFLAPNRVLSSGTG